MRFDEYYLKESVESYYEDYFLEMPEKVVDQFNNRKSDNDKQPWTVIPFSLISKIWNDYSRFGVVHNEKGLDKIIDIILNNIAKIQANTMLAGHEQIDPSEYFRSEEEEELFGDYILDEKGSLRISDYAIDKLINLAGKLLSAKNPEEKILIVDQILNIIHQRSDLSSWFIEGGRSSLDRLSDE